MKKQNERIQPNIEIPKDTIAKPKHSFVCSPAPLDITGFCLVGLDAIEILFPHLWQNS